MKTAIALKVKLKFVHDDMFSEDDIEKLIDRVYYALKDHADCSEAGLCPVEGYTEEIEVKGGLLYEVG